MINKIDKDLIIKFISINYPVKRIKHNGKFKRSIILNGDGVFFLSDKKKHEDLKSKLRVIIKYLFCVSDKDATTILNDSLKLK